MNMTYVLFDIGVFIVALLEGLVMGYFIRRGLRRPLDGLRRALDAAYLFDDNMISEGTTMFDDDRI